MHMHDGGAIFANATNYPEAEAEVGRDKGIQS